MCVKKGYLYTKCISFCFRERDEAWSVYPPLCFIVPCCFGQVIFFKFKPFSSIVLFRSPKALLASEFHADADFPERYFHLVLKWNSNISSVEVWSAAEGCLDKRLNPKLIEDFTLACATCATDALTVIYSDNKHNQTKINITDSTWERLKLCDLPVPDKEVKGHTNTHFSKK